MGYNHHLLKQSYSCIYMSFLVDRILHCFHILYNRLQSLYSLACIYIYDQFEPIVRLVSHCKLLGYRGRSYCTILLEDYIHSFQLYLHSIHSCICRIHTRPIIYQLHMRDNHERVDHCKLSILYRIFDILYPMHLYYHRIQKLDIHICQNCLIFS